MSAEWDGNTTQGRVAIKKIKSWGVNYFRETEAGGICMNLVSMLLTQSKRPTCISTQLLTLSFCKIGAPCSCLSWKSPEVLTAHTLPSLLLPYLSSISPNLSANMLYLTTQIAPNITWLKTSPPAQYSFGKFFLLYHQAPRKGSQCTSDFLSPSASWFSYWTALLESKPTFCHI